MERIISANDLRLGYVVKYEGDFWEVEKSDFTRQGRGGSTVQLRLKKIKDDSRKNLSVNGDIKFNTVDIEEEEFQYIYDDGDSLFTIDGSQYPISKVAKEILELIPQAERFRVIKVNDEIYKILLPKKARVKIKNIEPTLLGQTIKPYKLATLYNGWIIQVPLFIDKEDEVIIDTTNLVYDSKLS